MEKNIRREALCFLAPYALRLRFIPVFVLIDGSLTMTEFFKKYSHLLVTFLFIPLLYAIGYFYEMGFLDNFHVDIKIFNHDFSYYLINSLQLALTKVYPLYGFIKSKWVLFSCVATVVIVVTYYARLHEIKVKNTIDYAIRKVKRFSTARFISITIVGGAITSIIFYTLPLFLCGLFILPGWAYFQGIADSNELISTYRNCEKNVSENTKCIFVIQDSKIIASGVMITSSEKYVAIFDGRKTRIIPIDSKEIEVVR